MTQPDEYVIETRGLSKSFGSVQALRGVDLRVPRHSIFGFLGPNGAGKTTLIKVLLSLVRPSGGSATVFGRDITTDSVAIRERIGYLPQQPRFVEHMTARENLCFAARFFFSGPADCIRRRCDEMLELVGLTDKSDRPIKGFSGGEKQRLGIALAQINDPALLILDEPASALDPLGRQAVLDIMTRLRARATIFYSTHILDDVQRVSDSVAILDRGQVVASGPIGQLLNGQDGVVYTATLKDQAEDFGARIAALPWVTHATRAVSVPGNGDAARGAVTWHIGVSDEAAAERELLRHILQDPRATVIAFDRRRYELEEVFVNLVKGDRHVL